MNLYGTTTRSGACGPETIFELTLSGALTTLFLGIKPEQKFVSGELKPGKYALGMEFIREGAGKYHESRGKARLYVNDKVVTEGPMRAQVGNFTLCGDGLCVGYDSADAVSVEYKAPAAFAGGTILFAFSVD